MVGKIFMYKVMQKKTGIFFLLFFFALMNYPMVVLAEEPVVIVIDPGHGGKNLGAQYDGYKEKDITMIVAKAMKEELEQYDNTIVYLSHETDINMGIKERAEFAEMKNADFLCCLHFNASNEHNLFGSEVWVPARGELYVKGYQFGEILLRQFEDIGLYSRGIKTKLNEDKEEYYGILRYCSALNIPSVLIEHCYLDQAVDKAFYQVSEEQLREFGRMDAEAVAKFFCLRSTSKNIDYSNFPKENIDMQESIVIPDDTAPETARIEILSVDSATGELTVMASASDSDSYILYYKYSLDGGITYSDLQRWSRPVWNQSDSELTFRVMVPFEQEINLQVCFYNGFDLQTESNCITMDAISAPLEKKAVPIEKKVYEEINFEFEGDTSDYNESLRSDKVIIIMLILSISFLILFTLLALIKMVSKLEPNNKRRKKR